MTTMLSEVYDAFKAANVDDEKARKAAEAVAAYDQRSADIVNNLERLRSSVQMLKWQVGAVSAVIVILGAPALLLLVRVAAKVGALG